VSLNSEPFALRVQLTGYTHPLRLCLRGRKGCAPVAPPPLQTQKLRVTVMESLGKTGLLSGTTDAPT